jgi:hypothetical protein
VQGASRMLGRVPAPQQLDEAVGGNHLIRLEQQHGEQAPLTTTTHGNAVSPVDGFEPPQQSEPHESQ